MIKRKKLVFHFSQKQITVILVSFILVVLLVFLQGYILGVKSASKLDNKMPEPSSRKPALIKGKTEKIMKKESVMSAEGRENRGEKGIPPVKEQKTVHPDIEDTYKELFINKKEAMAPQKKRAPQ